MKFEELKNDLPETPDFIHQRIVAEVEKQVSMPGNTQGNTKAGGKHWSFGKMAAAAACAVLATSSVVYAGVRISHISSETYGTYGVTTRIEQETDQDITLPDEVSQVQIQANYIPEGMEWTDDSKLNYSDKEGGFSFLTLLMDEQDLDAIIQDTDVVEMETGTFGKYEGTYLCKNNLDAAGSVAYNQRFYLLCPDEYRVLVAYVSSNVSKEEAYKVMEQVELVETGEMMKTAEEYSRLSNYIKPEEVESISECITSMPEDQLTVHSVGEAVAVSMSGEDEEGIWTESSDLTATVDRVQIADDLSLLQEDRIPEEWKEAVGTDGKLEQNELSYIKTGDGVDTLDEIVSRTMENQKLVAVDVTYTNTGSESLKNILYFTSTMTIAHDANTYTIYDYEEQSGDGYDYVSGTSVASKGEMGYFGLFEQNGNGGNYIPSLAPGESVTIRMAWIVNERDLPDLYINLSSDGNGREFNEDTRLVALGNAD